MWCKPLMQRRDLGVEANLWPSRRLPHPPWTTIRLLPFWFPAVQRKKLTAAFDGGRLTSDGGVMLLAGADRQLGL